MSDAELFLLGWALIATVLAFKWKSEKETTQTMLMHFVRDEKARQYALDAWEKFKKANGVA